MSQTRSLPVVGVWLRLVVFNAVVGAVIGLIVATQIPPSYASRVSMIVAPPLSSTEISMNDIEVGQALAVTYEQVATTRPLLERVIASTGVQVTPEVLAAHISTRVPVSSNLLEITVSNSVPSVAALLANAIASELVDYPSQGKDATATPRVTLTVIDPAIPPTTKEGPGILLSTILGGGIGIIVALCVAFLVENLRGQGA